MNTNLTSTNAPNNSNRNSAKVIDLIPAIQQAAGGRFWSFLRNATLALLALMVALVLARLILGMVISFEVSDAVGQSAEAAGLDASITGWLRSVAAIGLGFGCVGIATRAILGMLFPFGKAVAGSWKPLVLLIAASGIGTALPVGIRSARGLDVDGLPVAMSEVDPAKSTWFNPKGKELIFFADHLDGERRFWNRPGHTPRDNAIALPVTMQTHGEWLRQQLEAQRAESAARKAEEAARAEQERQRATKAAAQAERERQQREHEQAIAHLQQQMQEAEARRAEAERQQAEIERQGVEAQRELEKQAARRAQEEAADRQTGAPVFRERPAENEVPAWSAPRPQPVEDAPRIPLAPGRFALRPGLTLNLHVNGDRVEIWSDGPVSASADHFGFRSIPQAGHRLRFTQGAQTIHVRPESRNARTLFIRKLDN